MHARRAEPCCARAAGERSDALEALDIDTVTQAKEILTSLGRTGLMPWAAPEYAEALAYISPSRIILLPPWHMILRGPLRQLVVYAATTPLKDVPKNDPIVWRGRARKAIQARSALLCCCMRLQVPVILVSLFMQSYTAATNALAKL